LLPSTRDCGKKESLFNPIEFLPAPPSQISPIRNIFRPQFHPPDIHLGDRPHPNPSPRGEGLKKVNVNNIDKAIMQIKNYIGQLSSPSPSGEGDRRG